MALTAEQITALNFHDYHQMILPYLNGGGVGLKLLWENSDPTSAFTEQDVSLANSDYDLLTVVYAWNTGSYTLSVTAKKDRSFLLSVGLPSASGARTCSREVTFLANGKLHFYGGKDAVGTTASSDNNNRCVPLFIYGIKVYNRDVQSDYEIIDGTIDSIGANAKKTITLSPTIPTGKKVIGWSMYAVDSDLQTYMQYYGGNYILCVKNIGNNAMTNKDYRVVFIYGQ